MYYYVFCSVQANYHNILTNKFEPLLENFEVSVEMMQVAPFFRAKTNVIINDIINYNLSVDSIIALNSFLLKFNQEEKMWDIKELIDPIKWRSTFAITEDVLKSATTRVYNLSLIFKNDSGIDLTIFFESNPKNLIKLKSGETKSYTSDSLYKARGINKYSSKIDRANFGVCLLNSYPINNINYKRTEYKQYKVNIELTGNKIIPLYFIIKIEPSYLINNVSFSSAIAFTNETDFKLITIIIQNINLEKYSINIYQNSKAYIPLSWLITQPPNSSIFIRFSSNGKMYKICDHISQLFQELNSDEKKEDSKQYDLKKRFNGNDNPKFSKITDIEKFEVNNMKNSKYIDINYQDNNYFLNFDFFVVQSKNAKNEIEKIKKRKEAMKTLNNNNLNSNELTINELNYSQTMNNQLNENLIPEINYEYIITIRHSL